VGSATSPLKGELKAKAAELGVPLEVVEKDYGLSYVLASVFEDDVLARCLVFKGGTALRKAYLPDYRFSVDLDFTATGGPRGDDMGAAVAGVASRTQDALLERGPFRVAYARRAERQPHPGDQEAFQIQLQYPWHSRPLCALKVEVTTDELVLLPTVDRPLLHSYDEQLSATLTCYSLEEIVAEKLRTPLQALKRVNEGKWLRNCARDYYDLWYLACVNSSDLNGAAVAGILERKCLARDVTFASAEDFFPPVVVADAARQWRSSLADLVATLPDFETAIAELATRISAILEGPQVPSPSVEA
jgi:uncharacterized protein